MKSSLFQVLFFTLCCWGCTEKNIVRLTPADLQGYDGLRWEQDSTVLVFANNARYSSANISLDKGKYVLRFKADATAANNSGPHFVIGLGQYTVREMLLDAGPKEYIIKFELPEAVNAPLQLVFDNDYSDPNSDRNIWLYFPLTIQPF